ncbi:hypothetical protein [Paraburkholderia phosphatilytica]|uniref:hypothetical protein n=1 Tax=Paraburkholderia phosphatilytica TaxID=2282883 RepID=UPI000E545C72|nr:hypothetical protein [Paraburkholderia phosphatilytica]
MSTFFVSDSVGAWASVVGSGIFHGINPATGWLFATAIGLQRGSRTALWMALPPLALGHALSILLLTGSVALLSSWSTLLPLHLMLGALLMGWACYQHVYGHRHRARVGMTAGFAGLTLWSAVMATMHGAGLMLTPALLSVCGGAGTGVPDGSGHGSAFDLALFAPLQFAVVHTVVMTATTAVIAVAAYEYFGLGLLRRGWINFNWLWSGALATTGAWLIFSG